MDRRKALGNIGKGIGTIIVTPSIVSIFQRCQSSKTFKPTFFKLEDCSFVFLLFFHISIFSSLNKGDQKKMIIKPKI